MNTIQVELALGAEAIWKEAYSRPDRDRDFVSAPPRVLPPVEEGCLQNVIVDLRDIPPEKLVATGSEIVYRVGGVEVDAEAILSRAEVLKALEVDAARTWVDVSEKKERIVGLLASGWGPRPRNTGISVRSPSFESVRTWSRIARSANVPLRFIWQTDGHGWRTTDLLAVLGIFAFSPPPAVLGIDSEGYSAADSEKLLYLVSSGLRELSLRGAGIQLISCPACARSQVNLRKIAAEIWNAVSELDANLCIAVMGCEVNGPGEARMADLGVACGKGMGLIFREGEILRRVPEAEILSAMVDEVHKILAARSTDKERQPT
jgi:4-hydroxy-3-methylbut-2-en-1-yl diphosphate synthase IspG/GcpE